MRKCTRLDSSLQEGELIENRKDEAQEVSPVATPSTPNIITLNG